MVWPFGKKEKKETIIVVDCSFHCPKSKACPKWTILYHRVPVLDKDGKETSEVKSVEEGRCALAWIPYLLTELMSVIRDKR